MVAVEYRSLIKRCHREMGSTLSSFATVAVVDDDDQSNINLSSTFSSSSSSLSSSSQMSIQQQRSHLDAARQLIAQQRPTEALEHIIAVVRTRGGGESAILAFLDDAKARSASLSPDQLATLLEKLSVSNDSVCAVDDERQRDSTAAHADEAAPHQSILEAQGRTAILRDAYRDGSSSLCIYCQSLIKSDRLDAHMSLWCDALVAEHD